MELFPKVKITYTRSEKLKRMITNNLKRKPSKPLILNIKDRDKKLVIKLVVENMYGGKFNLHKLYNKGKSRSTIILCGNLNKVIKRIIEEREKVESPMMFKLGGLMEKFNK